MTQVAQPWHSVALPPTYLACAECGVPVGPDAVPALVAQITARDGQPPRAPRPGPPSVVEVTFGRCASCRERAQRAAALLHAHPRVGGRLGTSTALHQVECALSALAVLGHGVRGQDNPMDLLEYLAAPGSAVRWAARFAPVAAADAALGTCAPSPWAHVPDSLRASLRCGYGGLLALRVARTAPVVALAPPVAAHATGVVVTGGCLFCGVGAVSVPAAAVVRHGGREEARRAVWQLLCASTQSLGGPITPDLLVG